MSDAQAPAGWFPDPEDAAQLRYWDGAAWTDHRHPADPAAAAAATAVPVADTVTPDAATPDAATPEAPTPDIPVAPIAAAETPQFAYAPSANVPPTAPGVVPAYGAPGAVAPAQNVPALIGLILAIVGTVLGLVLGVFVLIGIAGGVVSIVGMVQANKMRAAGLPGDRRGLALAGIIVGFGGLLLNLVIGGLVAVYYASMYSF